MSKRNLKEGKKCECWELSHSLKEYGRPVEPTRNNARAKKTNKFMQKGFGGLWAYVYVDTIRFMLNDFDNGNLSD